MPFDAWIFLGSFWSSLKIWTSTKTCFYENRPQKRAYAFPNIDWRTLPTAWETYCTLLKDFQASPTCRDWVPLRLLSPHRRHLPYSFACSIPSFFAQAAVAYLSLVEPWAVAFFVFTSFLNVKILGLWIPSNDDHLPVPQKLYLMRFYDILIYCF